jgi:hypothetical protein
MVCLQVAPGPLSIVPLTKQRRSPTRVQRARRAARREYAGGALWLAPCHERAPIPDARSRVMLAVQDSGAADAPTLVFLHGVRGTKRLMYVWRTGGASAADNPSTLLRRLVAECEWRRRERWRQSGHFTARRVARAARWSVAPSRQTRSTRTPGMSWKNSMVSMAIPAFLQGYQPPGASAYRQNPSSRMPETPLFCRGLGHVNLPPSPLVRGLLSPVSVCGRALLLLSPPAQHGYVEPLVPS